MTSPVPTAASLPAFTFNPDYTPTPISIALASDASGLIPGKYRRDRNDKIRDKRDECRTYDDYIIFDGETFDVEGYVHFGD